MIVIKTTDGIRFINEDEVKQVEHRKNGAMVIITYNNGSLDTVFQVESVMYTNKSESEINDHGLVLGAVTADMEYWKERTKCAEYFASRLADYRSELENFILSYTEKGQFDEGSYAAYYLGRIKEKQKDRPSSFSNELESYQNFACFSQVRKNNREKGDKFKKGFNRLTQDIKEKQKMLDIYEKTIYKLLNRNLWQRIRNSKPKTYLEVKNK